RPARERDGAALSALSTEAGGALGRGKFPPGGLTRAERKVLPNPLCGLCRGFLGGQGEGDEVGLALEPGSLPLGVAARRETDGLAAGGLVELPGQEGADFPQTDGLFRGGRKGTESRHFRGDASLEHGGGALQDALVEVLPLAVQVRSEE